jgi:hypothetical protein
MYPKFPPLSHYAKWLQHESITRFIYYGTEGWLGVKITQPTLPSFSHLAPYNWGGGSWVNVPKITLPLFVKNMLFLFKYFNIYFIDVINTFILLFFFFCRLFSCSGVYTCCHVFIFVYYALWYLFCVCSYTPNMLYIPNIY